MKTIDNRHIKRPRKNGTLLNLYRFNKKYNTNFKKEISHIIGFKFIIIRLDDTLAYYNRFNENFTFKNLNTGI